MKIFQYEVLLAKWWVIDIRPNMEDNLCSVFPYASPKYRKTSLTTHILQKYKNVCC